jgi:DNA primase
LSRIPEDVLDTVRSSVDLVELIGRYAPLKRSGRTYKACCPFHEEKTPSFVVWPQTGIWKCFGCGRAGNAYGFLMEKEGVSFREAAEQLARAAGITIEDDDPGARRQASRRTRLREACEWACRFFETWLRRPEGRGAVDYLKRRGITGETAQRFRLGYAPPGWEGLLRDGASSGFDEDLLVEAGLLVRRDPDDRRRGSGVYDRFRDRLVFPIADGQGRVIAFGARALGDAEPKYLNSPETPLFTKGRHLYALHLARPEMMRSGEGGVMEGYTDVVMAHQCGWPVAVAGLGTALTPQQASLVARHVKRLYLLYDGDAAGRAAAARAIPSFLPADIEARVALLPPGRDPCDILVEGGVEALRGHLDAAPEAFDHLLAAGGEAEDASSVAGRARAVDEALDALRGVTSQVRLALYLDRIADHLSVPREAVGARFAERQAASARRAPVRRPPPEEVPRDLGAAVDPALDAPAPEAERRLVESCLRAPALLEELGERLPREAVTHPGLRRLLVHLEELWRRDPEGFDAARALGTIPDPGVARLAAGLYASGERHVVEKVGEILLRQGRDCIRVLAEEHEHARLQQALRTSDEPDTEDEVLRRMAEFHARRARRTDAP